MSDTAEFDELVQRVRQGDSAAAEELVRQCEPQLRVIARARLRDSRLRRTLDSVDICQSVLANFFVRAAGGQFDLDSPDHLIKLLAKMVRNQVAGQARRQTADCRDMGRLADVSASDFADLAGTPSQIVATDELSRRFHARLSSEEQELLRLRREGSSWEELAVKFQTSPEALRKRLHRAVDEAAKAIGLCEYRF